MVFLKKELGRIYRHQRTRRRIIGTNERPRVCVHRSLSNFYVQVINDASRKVLFGLSTLTKDVRTKIKNGGNVDAAARLGEIFAPPAKKKRITKNFFFHPRFFFCGRGGRSSPQDGVGRKHSRRS